MRVTFSNNKASVKFERSDLRKLRDAADVLNAAHSIVADECCLRAHAALTAVIEKAEFGLAPKPGVIDPQELANRDQDEEHPFPPAPPVETPPPVSGSFGERLNELRNRDAQRQMSEASGQLLSSDDSPLEPF